MRKVIVTGGCGYIGSHVARAFKNAGDQVFIIDNVMREHTLKGIDGWFIDHFASDASLATIVDFAPDIIVHCAGTSLVSPSMTNPSEYYNNNIVKTIRMMDVVKDLPKRPVVMFSSSASVYGNPKSVPIKTNAQIQPISPYGSTKASGELIFRDYGNAYGIDTVCFRYFNAAGAEPINGDLGQELEATHIIPQILKSHIEGRVFNVYGNDYNTPDGTCIRDYVHVWDIAQAHINAADYLKIAGDFLGNRTDRTASQLVFNLGTNKGISNQEIVDYVVNKYGLTGVNYSVRRSGDPDELVADSQETTMMIGWEPKYSDLATIIDSAYKWHTRGI